MLKPILQPSLSAVHCENLKEIFSSAFCVAKKLKKSIESGGTADFTNGCISVQLLVFKLSYLGIITVFLDMLDSLCLYEITTRFGTDVWF